MNKTLGNIETLHGNSAIRFDLKLAAEPLDLSWHHCGVTSDFIGEYMSRSCENGIDANSARHSISYMINEILENAVKFRHGGNIELAGSLEAGTFEITIENQIDSGTAKKFRAYLETLLHREPGELLIERMEENALDPESSGSGLGLLTLMSDYGAKLGWSFSPPVDVGETVSLTTHASLPLS